MSTFDDGTRSNHGQGMRTTPERASSLSELPHKANERGSSTDLTCICVSTREVFNGTRFRAHDTTVPATSSQALSLACRGPFRFNVFILA
ncbi:hypothetical protein TNCV_974151 [Trichonephila clavipes]|nr:hypothetical protein TNCV_974151 [Trichonephila clavipes]